MDMHQKRKMRAENKKNDKEKSFPNVSINWYPGHMAKTKKQIMDDIKLIDVVVEILDARIPFSSQNPDLNEMIRNKKRIIVLNKSDLADDIQTKKWLEYYKINNINAIAINSNSGKGIEESIKVIKNIMKEELKKQAERGIVGKNIRILIAGIPNVGKSSYINRVTKKASAKVGNKPGVTKQKQWVKLDNQIELLDTPGVLWPKIQNETVGLNLSYTGTIKDDILELTDIAYNLIKYLLENYNKNLTDRYEIELSSDAVETMEQIGRKRGALISGGRVDLEKVARIILEDFRNGKLGKITLEKVEE